MVSIFMVAIDSLKGNRNSESCAAERAYYERGVINPPHPDKVPTLVFSAAWAKGGILLLAGIIAKPSPSVRIWALCLLYLAPCAQPTAVGRGLGPMAWRGRWGHSQDPLWRCEPSLQKIFPPFQTQGNPHQKPFLEDGGVWNHGRSKGLCRERWGWIPWEKTSSRDGVTGGSDPFGCCVRTSALMVLDFRDSV